MRSGHKQDALQLSGGNLMANVEGTRKVYGQKWLEFDKIGLYVRSVR
jgi:hypothetical protein